MPQNGFHGLVGLATARAVAPRTSLAARIPFVFGIVLGAMLPDADMYPTGIAVLAKGMDQVYLFHRTASHSVFFLLLLCLIALITKVKSATSWVFWGLALGGLTHVVLDIFFWFAGIDIMWPLSHLPADAPIFNPISIWTSNYSGIVSNLRDACEFAAFALFLMSIRKIANATNAFQLWMIRILWLLFAIAIITAFFLRPGTQQIMINVPYLLLFLPYCWQQTWKYRTEIALWAGSVREANA